MTQGAATRYAPLPATFTLHTGGVLPNGRIAFETFGVADTTGERTILLFTGLSASAHASASPRDPTPGWWQQIVGPGRAIDTDQWFVVCVNSLGSCFGSSGPTDTDAKGRRWGPRFPTVSIEDIATGGWYVLQHLGLARVHSVVGASLGGMTVLAFAARHPGAARHLVSISGTLAPSTIAIGLRAVQREAIERDPAFLEGDYAPERPPRAGLRLARMLGTLTYRAPAGLQRRFGRQQTHGQFDIEHYLALQGERFADSFDANAYLQLSRAMDRFDLAIDGDPARAFVAAKLETALVIGVEQDLLFPITDQERIVEALERAGVPTRFVRVASDEGHDAFLLDLAPFDAALRRHLKREDLDQALRAL
mgnify:FL=1